MDNYIILVSCLLFCLIVVTDTTTFEIDACGEAYPVDHIDYLNRNDSIALSFYNYRYEYYYGWYAKCFCYVSNAYEELIHIQPEIAFVHNSFKCDYYDDDDCEYLAYASCNDTQSCSFTYFTEHDTDSFDTYHFGRKESLFHLIIFEDYRLGYYGILRARIVLTAIRSLDIRVRCTRLNRWDRSHPPQPTWRPPTTFTSTAQTTHQTRRQTDTTSTTLLGNEMKENGNSTGIIIGAAIGAIGFICALVGGAAFLIYRKRKNETNNNTHRQHATNRGFGEEVRYATNSDMVVHDVHTSIAIARQWSQGPNHRAASSTELPMYAQVSKEPKQKKTNGPALPTASQNDETYQIVPKSSENNNETYQNIDELEREDDYADDLEDCTQFKRPTGDRIMTTGKSTENDSVLMHENILYSVDNEGQESKDLYELATAPQFTPVNDKVVMHENEMYGD